ncbi:FAD-dependent oxidoreductase, partial [Pseudomonas aeruginosa]
MSFDFDLFVIGAGSGGVRAARFAAGFGARVAVVESRYLGGTCVNVGCVPKKLLVYGAHFSEDFEQARAYGWSAGEAQFDWATLIGNKNREIQRLNGIYRNLLVNSGVTLLEGHARLLDAHSVEVDGQRFSAKHILVATGGWPQVPDIPGKEHAITSNEAFFLERLPRRVLVVGGGYIGLELGTAYRKLGVEVAVVEAQPRILPGYDEELTKPVAQALRKLGVELYLGHSLLGPSENGVRVRDGAGEEREIAADQVLVAVGRKPRSEGWNLESLGLDMNGRAVKVDDQCRTSMRNVWAIGDLAGEPMLAHRAMAQGEMVGEPVSYTHLRAH